MSKASGEIRVLVQATQQGFQEASAKIAALAAQVEKLNTAGNQNSFANLEKGMKTLIGTVTTLTNSVNGLTQSFAKSTTSASNFANKLTMQWNFKSIIHDMNQLLAVQMRWYAVQPLATAMQTALYAPFQGAVAIGQYITEISQARGELLRWGATTGSVSEDARRGIESLLSTIQKTTTQFPITFKDLSETVQAFIGAGIPTQTVERMVADIARMKIAFPEIDYKQFSIALTGAYNVFKDTIAGIKDEADGMSAVMDKILAAQATGIIRPEQFTTVLQYMSEIGKLEGFTLDQILALSVAITDTGIKANSASRLLASMTLSLQSSAGRSKLLDDFGIQINRNIPLAQQFTQIIEGLKAKIGSGPVSVGWMAALEDLVGKEQAKDLAALIDKLKRYEEVVKLIEQSHGGLVKSAEVMAQTLPNQWLLLTNIVKQFGAALAGTDIENKFTGIMATLIDMAQGLLAAADTTGVYSSEVDKLGVAGKGLYDVITGLKTAIGNLTDILKTAYDIIVKIGDKLGPLGDMFKKVSEHVDLLRIAVELLVNILMVRLGIAAFGALSKGFTSIVTNAAKASLGMGALGGAITALTTGSGPLALLIIGLTVINGLMDHFNQKIGAMQAESAAFFERLKTAKTSDLESEDLPKYGSKLIAARNTIKDTESRMAAIRGNLKAEKETYIKDEDEKKEEYIKDPFTNRFKALKSGQNKIREEYNTLYEQRQQAYADEEEARGRIAAIKGTIGERNREEKATKDTGTGAPPPDTLGRLKSYGESELQSIKKVYNAGITQIQSDTVTKLSTMDDQYKMGAYKTFEEYTTAKEKVIKDSETATLWMLNDEEIAITNKYEEMRVAIQNAAKRKGEDPATAAANKAAALEKIDNQELADLEVLETKRTEVKNKATRRESEAGLELFERTKKEEIRKVEDEFRFKEDQAHLEVELIKSNDQIIENISTDMYKNLEVSATDYYNLLYNNIEKEAAKEKWLVDEVIRLKEEELKAKREALAKIPTDMAIPADLTPDEIKKTEQYIELLKKQRALRYEQIDQGKKEKTTSLDLKKKDDVQAIYENAINKSRAERKLGPAQFTKPTDQLAAIEEKGGAEGVKESWSVAVASIKDSFVGGAAVGEDVVDKLSTKWMNAAKNWEESWNNMANSMADTFESVFVDAMNGDLKTAGEYFESFVKSVMAGLFKIAAQEMAVMAMKGVSTAVSALLFHEGGVVGSPSVPAHSTKSVSFVGAPKFHTGLAPDEYPAILQKGEAVVPRNKVNQAIIDYILNKKTIVSKEDEEKKTKSLQNTVSNISNTITKNKEFTELFKKYGVTESIFEGAPKFHTGMVPSDSVSEKDVTKITDLNSITKDKKRESSVLQKVVDRVTSMVSSSADFAKTVSKYKSSSVEERNTILQKVVEDISNTVNKSSEFTKGVDSYTSDAERQTDITKSNVLKRVIDNISTIITGNRSFTNAISSSKEFAKFTEKHNVIPAIFGSAPKYHKGLYPDEFPAILQKGEAVIPKDNVRYISEKEKTFETTTDRVSISLQKTINSISSILQKDSIEKHLSSEVLREKKELFNNSKNNVIDLVQRLNTEKISSVLQKDRAEHSSDKEKTSSVMQKMTEKLSTFTQKDSTEHAFNRESSATSRIDAENSTNISKSILQKLTEIFTSVLKTDKTTVEKEKSSVEKDNVIRFSDVLKERETEKSSASESKSIINNIVSVLSGLSKETSISKIFENVYARSEGVISSVENIIGGTNINNSEVSNSESTAASTNVVSFHKGGIVPVFHKGGFVLPTFHGGGVVPVFHGGGLNSDERMAVLQTKERVLSREQTVMMDNMYNRVMNINNNAAPTNVEVNIINQSSQNVKAEQKSTKLDMERTVVTIVLKDITNNGSLYGAIKGVR